MPNNGTATVLEEAPILQPSEPLRMRPARGKIVGTDGNTLHPDEAPNLMARIDQKGQKEVTLRQSTLWFVGTALVLAGVIFSYGTSAIAWVRDDESQRVKIANVERQVEEMRSEIKALTALLTEQRVKDAEKRGYELGNLDNRDGHSAVPKK